MSRHRPYYGLTKRAQLAIPEALPVARDLPLARLLWRLAQDDRIDYGMPADELPQPTLRRAVRDGWVEEIHSRQ